jgi:hypothetical protein
MKKRDAMIVRFACAALAACVTGCAGGTAATSPALPVASSALSTGASRETMPEILITNYENAKPTTVVEFARGVRGNASPLRSFAAIAPAFGLRTDGSYWSGPYHAGTSPDDPGWVELHSAGGTTVRIIHGVKNEPMHQATADRTGDLIVSDYVESPGGECNAAGHLRYYSFAQSFKMTRAIDDQGPCINVIYASKRFIYIGYDESDYYSDDLAVIVQLASTATNVNQTVRSFDLGFPYVSFKGMQTDTHGNLFALAGNELFEYAPGDSTAKFVLKGVPVTCFALDSENDLYAIVGTYIEEFAPHASKPFRVIGGPATGLTNPGAISVSD